MEELSKSLGQFRKETAAIHELEAVLKETVFDGRLNAGFLPTDDEHEDDDEEIDDNSRDYMTIAELTTPRPSS
jgi:hypothetical protein